MEVMIMKSKVQRRQIIDVFNLESGLQGYSEIILGQTRECRFLIRCDWRRHGAKRGVFLGLKNACTHVASARDYGVPITRLRLDTEHVY